MKIKTRLLLLALTLGLCVSGASAQSYVLPTTNLNLGATSLAANSTNATPGTAYVFPLDYPAKTGRFFLSASGTAATTNGSLTVYLTTSTDRGGTNGFDTGTLSALKLTMTALGNGTNQVSDWAVLDGVTALRVDRIENTFAGPVSNLSLAATFKDDK